MNLRPHSLFGRNLLLLIVLIIASQLGGALIVREIVIKPRVEQLAVLSAANLEAMRVALESLPIPERERFIARVNSEVGVHVSPADGAVRGFTQPILPAQRMFLRLLGELTRDRGTDIKWSAEPENTLWVRLSAGERSYWVTVDAGPLDLGMSRAWFWMTVLGSLIAAVGAITIKHRLDRPIRELIVATTQIGEGGQPRVLPEDGPREIADLAHSFNRMNERLKCADVQRTLMLAGVSHDLRSPLSKLRLALEISAPGIEPDIYAGMERNIEAIDAIIGQFLDFARPETEEPPVPTDLGTLLADAVAVQGQGPIQFESAWPHGLQLPMRARAMRRVVDNLIENAKRYGKPPFSVSCGIDGLMAWFVVRDGGQGIAETEIEAVRKPFARGDNARGGSSGAGLGLAIADRIVELHRGVLTMGRCASGGFEVRVELPLLHVVLMR